MGLEGLGVYHYYQVLR